MRRSQYLGTEVHSLHYGAESGPRYLGGYFDEESLAMAAMKSAIHSAHNTVAQDIDRQQRREDAQQALADIAFAEYVVPRPTDTEER